MKARHLPTLLGGLCLFPTVVLAQFPGHYPPGVEGIKGASLPPPGLYLRDYNLIYTADRYPGSGLNDFEATVYVNAPRIIYMTDKTILGATYGLDLIVPFGYADVKGAGGALDDSYFGLYDIQFEPVLLAWHLRQFDIGVGYSFWAPSGDTPTPRPGMPPADAANLGKGFWSHMFTAGATWFIDTNKTWSVSVLNRYEVHHEDDGIRVGDSYTMEFGASKLFAGIVDAGVCGYYQQQVTGTTGQGDARPSTVGIGPEVSVVFPKVMTFLSLRWVHELASHRRPEGDTLTLTLTKRF